MGKGAKRPRKAGKGFSGKSRTRDDDNPFLRGDMDDEIDAFHKHRDVISLDPDDDIGESDDEDLENPVLDVEESGDDESDGEEEDTPAINKLVKDKGLTGKIARQAKYLKEKFGAANDESDDEEEKEEERKEFWGRGKNIYYDADNVDYELQSSDEELPLEEEAEVLKIQREKAKSLSLEDFGLQEDDGDDSDSDGNRIHQETFDGRTMQKRSTDGAMEDDLFHDFEEIKKDFTTLSKVEQMDVVYSSAPELVGLLSELNDALDQIQRLEPDLCKVSERKTRSREGLPYLEAKHILLLTYCQAITFYLLLKSEGNTIRDHPVIGRLVEIKNLLQKMEEIKVNIPSESEEIPNATTVRSSKTTLSSGNVPSEAKSDKASKVPPKLLKLESDIMKDSPSNNNDSKSADKNKQDAQVSIQSLEMLKIRASLEAKLNEKGIYRSLSSKTGNMQKEARKVYNRHLESIDDFDDEAHQTALQSKKLSQLVGTKTSKIKSLAGKEDLPKRDDIGERQRKHELRVLASAGAVDTDEIKDGAEDDGRSSSMDIAAEDGEVSGSEDEFYREVKRQKTEKQMAKAELYLRIPAVPLPQETEVDGKRQITYQMEKNKGLTRARKKLTKNPRKKYRIKHRSAAIRRKGQVRDIRKPSGPYGGEHTGINVNVSRSVRFKS